MSNDVFVGQEDICPFVLIKTGRKEHIDSLYRNGEIYAQTFNYFRNCENMGDGRADTNEYDTECYSINAKNLESLSITFTSSGKNSPEQHIDFIVDESNGLLGYSLRNPAEEIYTHLFCLSISDNVEFYQTGRLLKECNFAEGKDYALIITDVFEFLNRLKNGLKKISRNCQARAVTYYDPCKTAQKLDCFYKKNSFSYQNEWRVAIQSNSKEPLKFQIGSLCDIAKPPMNKEEFLNFHFEKNSFPVGHKC